MQGVQETIQPKVSFNQEPTESSNQPIKAGHLGHVISQSGTSISWFSRFLVLTFLDPSCCFVLRNSRF